MYETKAGIPTRGDTYAKLIHHLREAQDSAAMLAHLHNTESNPKDVIIAKGWFNVEELIKKMIHNLAVLAKWQMQ